LHFNKLTNNILEKYVDIVKHNDFLAIDTLRIDDHLRLTFTKRTKNILPVRTRDELAIFRDKTNNTILFNLQREGVIVDIWILRRLSEVVDYNHQIRSLDIQSIPNANAASTTLEKQHQIADDYRLPDIPEGQSGTQKDTKLLNAGHSNLIASTDDNKSSSKMKSTRTVMIVDDEPDILMTFSMTLREHGIYSETFTNSADALLRFTEAGPSYFGLVILDIRMPVLNGLQLYKIMNAQRKDTKFLFVSALDYAAEFIQMLPDIGTENVLSKPIGKDTLVERVVDLLEGTIVGQDQARNEAEIYENFTLRKD
jgi:CheY-like chemotaxis protein